jgi:NitT/TauT family transport system substrate-binding protein
VNYLFHGPLGLQTRDLTWKPEYRQAVGTSIDTLKLLKKADQGLDVDKFVVDKYIREAFKGAGLDYEASLKNYDQLPLKAKDAATGEDIKDFKRVAQIWVKDEPKVRHYATAEGALKALKTLETEGKTARVFYAQDRDSGIKLLGAQAWFVRADNGEVSAFLLKEQAEKWSKDHGGKVLDYNGARAAVLASN